MLGAFSVVLDVIYNRIVLSLVGVWHCMTVYHSVFLCACQWQVVKAITYVVRVNNTRCKRGPFLLFSLPIIPRHWRWLNNTNSNTSLPQRQRLFHLIWNSGYYCIRGNLRCVCGYNCVYDTWQQECRAKDRFARVWGILGTWSVLHVYIW
jgi:hypothetical protein